MLTTIKSYLITGWIVLMLSLLGYSYKLHGDVQRLELEVYTFQQAAEANAKALEQAKSSCIVSVEALTEHYRKESVLNASQQATGDAINALPTLTLKEKANVAPTKPQSFSDDDRLSPDLMRLLDNAYCDGNKDSCASSAE
jgi:hypothetical protein